MTLTLEKDWLYRTGWWNVIFIICTVISVEKIFLLHWSNQITWSCQSDLALWIINTEIIFFIEYCRQGRMWIWKDGYFKEIYHFVVKSCLVWKIPLLPCDIEDSWWKYIYIWCLNLLTCITQPCKKRHQFNEKNMITKIITPNSIWITVFYKV